MQRGYMYIHMYARYIDILFDISIYRYLFLDSHIGRPYHVAPPQCTVCSLNTRGIGTSRTERGRSWSSVPFLRQKPCLGPCRILGLANRVSNTNGILFVRMPRHSTRFVSAIGVHVRVHLRWCPNPRCYACPFGQRAVRSSERSKRGTCNTCFSSSKMYSFSRGCTGSIRFPLRSRSAPIHVSNNAPFGLFQLFFFREG